MAVPQAPRLRIGVTGHRFLEAVETLEAGVDRVLVMIERWRPGHSWTLLTSLAEGADRLVARRVAAFKPQVRLCVPLPLPVADYLTDFADEAARQEFKDWLLQAEEVLPPPHAEPRPQCYWTAGRTVLATCDVLLALWDGQPARGVGGTGQMIAEARRSGLPLAWVRCGNPRAVEGQGTVILERLE